MQCRSYLCRIVRVNWIVGLILSATAPSVSANELDSAALALETIFCPNRVPPNRTMGLVQRNFLDLVETSKAKLEIAFVVDGTDSMEQSLQGAKRTIDQMMTDLQLYKQAEVSYQLVVYRDAGVAPHEVTFSLKVAGREFTSDREAFRRAFDALEVQSGAPYFHELIDAGIHEAISQLQWSTDQETTKWLFVIGDAPPFDAGFDEPETQARRRFDTKLLTGLASAKEIQINCILCSSREQEQQSHEAVLDRTRSFMSSLATETGGLMLDLSYPDVRNAIIAAARKPRSTYLRIGKITRQEVDELRAQAQQNSTSLSTSRRARIAVLPHAPLGEMSFRSNRPEVRIATDLRRRLRSVPGIEVKSSRAVEQQFRQLRRQDLEESQLLQMLSSALEVDYLLWGTMSQQGGVVQLGSSIYRGGDGRRIVSGRGRKESVSDAASAVMLDVVNRMNRRTDPKLVSLLRGLDGGNEMTRRLTTPVSNNVQTADRMLVAYDLLERVAGLEAGHADADPLLGEAKLALEEALRQDPRNPIAHQLMASCHFNLAQVQKRRGTPQSAQQEFESARAELERAKSLRNARRIPEEVKTEISADYALLGQKDVEEAIRLYESLTGVIAEGTSPIQLHLALRAHWMLAGIYSGDWGVPDTFIQPEKAKLHLKSILAHWPKSHEAEFIRRQLRWNHQTGENSFEHYPRNTFTIHIES